MPPGWVCAVDGHGPLDCPLVCVNVKTGEEIWREEPRWAEEVDTPQGKLRRNFGLNRSFLLHAGEREAALNAMSDSFAAAGGPVLGGVFLGFGVATLLVTPFGGVAADRLPKRTVILCSIGCLVVSAPPYATEPGAAARLASDSAFADWSGTLYVYEEFKEGE